MKPTILGAAPPRPISPDARRLFSLNDQVAHLNHASFGSVPVPVQQAQQRLRDESDSDPMPFFANSLPERIAHTRRQVGRFLGADPDGTVLTLNVSTGIATVLHTLDLGSGDEVVVSNHSHYAVDYALERERRRRGVVVRRVELPLTASDDEVVKAMTGAVRPGRTKLVVIAHITSETARLMPVADLAAALRAMDVPLLVDAAHAPGMVPTPVAGVGADFWIGNLHKWSFAPRGASALVVAPEWRERTEPLVVSLRYNAGFPASFDQPGAFDYTGWLAAPVGIELLQDLGLAAVCSHNAELAAYGQQVVASALGVEPDDLPAPSEGVSMALVPFPHGVAASTEGVEVMRRRVYDELRAEVAIRFWEGRAYLRLSAQVYNTAEEYERLAEGLAGILRDRAL